MISDQNYNRKFENSLLILIIILYQCDLYLLMINI